MGDRVRAFAWARTSLGPPGAWPRELRIVLDLVLRSPSPMVIWWGAELIQLYNDAYAALLRGSRHPAALGRSARETWAESWGVMGPMVEAVMERGEGASVRTEPLALDGNARLEERGVEHACSPIRDGSGHVAGILATCNDVLDGRRLATILGLGDATASKQAQEKDLPLVEIVNDIFASVAAHEETEKRLLESDQRMRLATEATGVGIWEWNIITDRIQWDAQMFRIYGMAPTPDGFIRYSTWRSMVEPEDFPSQEEQLRDVVRRQGHGAREFRIRRADSGERRYVQAIDAARLNAEGRVEWVVGTNLDITERKQTEQTLRESEERFRTLADQTPVILWVTNPGGAIEFANDAYCAFFGVERERALGMGWDRLVHPSDEAYLQALRAALRARRPYRAEARARRSDGEWRCIESAGFPRYSSSGEFLGMIGTTQDVTDRKQAAALQEQIAKQKDDFIAVLAHELRNPLAPIRTSVGVLRARAKDDPLIVRCQDVIERQVAHMARLLDDLLDVSRLSRGALSLHRARVSLSDVLADAIEVSRPNIDAQRQALTVEGLDPSLVLDADATRLIQVFGNLLTNAAKYSAPDTHIHVLVRREGSDAVISVRDEGVGIPRARIGRIFQIFVQGEPVEGHAPAGLGIGLSLSRSLVELHGGSIEAFSAGPGHGSTFEVRLPALPAEQPAPGSAVPADAPREVSRGHRVLIADDNADAADLLALLLESMGCDTRTVYDGEAAIREAERYRPDLALLDIGMPGLDGYQACHRIRSQSWAKGMKLVALTGWGTAEDRRRSAEAGFVQHLVKPVDSAALAELVRDSPRRTLDRRAGDEQARGHSARQEPAGPGAPSRAKSARS